MVKPGDSQLPRSAKDEQGPLSEENLRQLETEVHEIREITVSRSGPLPDPAELQAYEAACPGAADRIITMAEKEQDNRHELERAAVRQPFLLSKRGQGCGLAALLVLAAFGAYLASLGHPGWATTVISIDFLGVVAVFVTGQVISRPKRSSKAEGDEDNGDVDENDGDGATES